MLVKVLVDHGSVEDEEPKRLWLLKRNEFDRVELKICFIIMSTKPQHVLLSINNNCLFISSRQHVSSNRSPTAAEERPLALQHGCLRRQ